MQNLWKITNQTTEHGILFEQTHETGDKIPNKSRKRRFAQEFGLALFDLIEEDLQVLFAILKFKRFTIEIITPPDRSMRQVVVAVVSVFWQYDYVAFICVARKNS